MEASITSTTNCSYPSVGWPVFKQKRIQEITRWAFHNHEPGPCPLLSPGNLLIVYIDQSYKALYQGLKSGPHQNDHGLRWLCSSPKLLEKFRRANARRGPAEAILGRLDVKFVELQTCKFRDTIPEWQVDTVICTIFGWGKQWLYDVMASGIGMTLCACRHIYIYILLCIG